MSDWKRSNIERMKDSAIATREVLARVSRRIFYRELTRAEIQAFVALGRMEQFMNDLDGILADTVLRGASNCF